MRVDALDTVFVRARRSDVHPILRDVGGYGRWWPGLDLVRLDDRTFDLRLAGARPWRPRQRLLMAVHKDRPDKGVRFRLSGDIVGESEWYYLDERAGVVVHYALRGEAPQRGWRRRLADHRAGVRRAFNALKDALEVDRLPGAEPDAVLLADQEEAIIAFRADVEAARASSAGGEGTR